MWSAMLTRTRRSRALAVIEYVKPIMGKRHSRWRQHSRNTGSVWESEPETKAIQPPMVPLAPNGPVDEDTRP
jgi:hypothetical protein